MSRLGAITDWSEKAKLASYNASELAKLCLVSPSQLRRYFALVFGNSPEHWLNELRLWHAARVLCSGLSVKEVALELHFFDEAHFCHSFRRYHGCTPLEFVRRHRLGGQHSATAIRGSLRTKSSPAVLAPPWEIAEKQLLQRIGEAHFGSIARNAQNARRIQ